MHVYVYLWSAAIFLTPVFTRRWHMTSWAVITAPKIVKEKYILCFNFSVIFWNIVVEIIIIIIFIIIVIIIFITIIIITIIIITVMCVSGQFYNRRFFSNSSFSVLCSKNFEVMKLNATRYDETNVDIYSILILNMEKPKFLNGIFLVIIIIVFTNYSNIRIIVCTNYYFISKSVYKTYF